MTAVRIAFTDIAGTHGLPHLIVGPSLGTSVTALWASTATQLANNYHITGWDLPGHGNSPEPQQPFTISDLAKSMSQFISALPTEVPVHYAGVSVAGAVGLQLLLDHPTIISTATLICTGAKIGDPDDWHSRAHRVSTEGTPALVSNATARWFARDFSQRDPDSVNALLESLRHTNPTGYAHTCRALAQFDVRGRLHQIATPLLAIAGANDIATPPTQLQAIAHGVANGQYAELTNTAHLAPAEQPSAVAQLITNHIKRFAHDR
jgi:3-oxoadipate enol-lactonase/4-carboxymuconolactone decarboxylase